MVDRFERFSFAISEISRYRHKLAAVEMERYGLKGPHSVYLLAMHRHPEGITAPQLCELCGKDKSDVSRMIPILQEKGLVTKEGIHQSSYRGILKLTEEGNKAAEAISKRADLAVQLAGKDLTDENREIFYAALESIAANLRILSKEGLPLPVQAPDNETDIASKD